MKKIQFESHAEMAAAFGSVACLLSKAIVVGARDRANLSTYFAEVRCELLAEFKNNWISEGMSYQAEAQVGSKVVPMIEALIDVARLDLGKEKQTTGDAGKDGVAFRGAGPFNLPIAQRAFATGHAGNGVTLTMYSLIRKEGESETALEAINVQMTSSVARELGAALLQAAIEGDQNAKLRRGG